jgi:hypothetical protein
MSENSAVSFVESDHEFFELTGPLPTAWDDHRRFPRFYYRSCAEAIVYPMRSGKSPIPAQCVLLTRDLSRGGLSLVHNAQLFPGQRLDVLLNGEAPRQVDVVWCRRWTEGRYIVGCRFMGGETPAAEDTAPIPAEAS